MRSAKKKHWNLLHDAKPKKGDGRQRHFRGRMTLPGGSPRAHTHGGHSQANAGFASYDCPPNTMRGTPGRYKVSEPKKSWQRSGIYRTATTSEVIV